jgi:hypothetical protein
VIVLGMSGLGSGVKEGLDECVRAVCPGVEEEFGMSV